MTMATVNAEAPRAGKPYADRTLSDIAVQIPGATAIFRKYKLDFCCGGSVPLAQAAARKDLSTDEIVDELRRIDGHFSSEAPAQTAALIDHIIRRYHDVHRRELPELIRLARRVEAVHRDHPKVPAGLADGLQEILRELDEHMQKEELVLFPMMRDGGNPMIGMPIARMRVEHDEHGERLRRLEALTDYGQCPEGACPTWRALYAGTRKLVDDLMEHIHLENNVLFPRFMGREA
jgi:regulator of cell morphogenesis and NO signaling